MLNLGYISIEYYFKGFRAFLGYSKKPAKILLDKILPIFEKKRRKICMKETI